MKPRQKSTIYDIAQKAGASPSAVSAALNGTWKQRRLKRETAERIQKIADEEGYTPNLQARGLRNARSGLAGMVLPHHDNRFFAELSQHFAREAHDRGLCPAIVHSGRDPDDQLAAVESLISYAIDLLVIAGATDPARLARACRKATLPHVFVDQPCAEAPSVTTENAGGAARLTARLLQDMPPPRADDPRTWLYFLGGETGSPASADRIRGFLSVVAPGQTPARPEQVIACGYDAGKAERALAALRQRLGVLPAGLFVNSIDCFEGVLKGLAGLPEAEITQTRIGCFDHEPFAALSRFPLHMLRQRADLMIHEAFGLLDAGVSGPGLIRVEAELI